MKCNVKIVSPVHIGSGDSYSASEYLPVVVTNKSKKKIKTFKRIDVSSYYLSLDEDKKDLFINDLSNPNFTLKDFDKKIPNTFKKYIAIDKCSQKPTTQPIEETIKTLNKAYIPGSSIKGAIKTAVLYDLFDMDDCDEISGFINKRGRDFNRSYNNFLDKFFTSKIRLPSAQKDVFKFLQVSDTNDVKQIGIYDILTVMAAEFGGRKSNIFYKKNKRSNNPTISYYETVVSGNKLEFSLKNNYIDNVHSELKLGDKTNLININYLKRAIYNFSKDYIDYELNFSREYGIDSLNKFYSNISKLNTKDTPLLKIGAGSGFLATTVGMKIQEYDPGLYDAIRKQKRSYEFSFPKSRKITKVGGKPLGWIQLNFEGEP